MVCRSPEATAIKVSISMPVIKEMGARWLVALYAKLSSEKSAHVNGFTRAGIRKAAEKTRGAPDREEPFAED